MEGREEGERVGSAGAEAPAGGGGEEGAGVKAGEDGGGERGVHRRRERLDQIWRERRGHGGGGIAADCCVLCWWGD